MSPPRFSIVTTCKGRLDHLRQSLPIFLAQPGAEVVVVDYDCPQKTRDIVARDFPAARLVAVDDAPVFNLARARNLGAAVAGGEWLAFVDADIILVPDFADRIAGLLAPGRFHHFKITTRETVSAHGSCLVRRADFAAVEGYDEVVDGYGAEDQDFYFRLTLAGLEEETFDFSLIARIIHHDNAARVQFGRHGSLLKHQRVNSAYLLVKNSLLRQLGPTGLSEEQRRQLYRLVRDVIADANREPDAPVHFTIELPQDRGFMPIPAWRARRHLVFDLTPRELLGPDD
jgi:glycosyltransferase involved in cell wall biosynthesis